MGFKFLTAFAVSVLMLAGSAAAQSDSRVVYAHKAWEVRVVAFDDATLACVAKVDKPGSYFSIWADGNSSVELVMYSNAWSFGDSTADVVVQIDRRAKWDLTNADLSGSSVMFTLPNNDSAERFLLEVVRGNTVKLYNTSNRLIESWSLAGSAASINALIDCTNALLSDLDGNPFN